MTNVVLNTSGNGYWSSVQRAVHITDMRIGYVDDDVEFGELRVYFDCDTWDIRKHGLIYTDMKFLRELHKFLIEQGLTANDVSYSEQGMQGTDYVSLDVGKRFLAAWAKKFAINWQDVLADPRGIRAACVA